MKKYTAAYGEWFGRGSVRNTVVKYKHIEVDNLKAWMDTNEEIDPGNIWFFFEGHSVEESN